MQGSSLPRQADKTKCPAIMRQHFPWMGNLATNKA